MNEENKKSYVSNEAAKFINHSKLLVFSERLRLSKTKDYAKVHASGEESDDNGWRQYSTIGILARDFKRGDGGSIKVDANLSPTEFETLYELIKANINTETTVMLHESFKIFGAPNENGYSHVRKLVIGRVLADKNGIPRKSPWYVHVENGIGKKVTAASGGCFCEKGSYICQSRVSVYLTLCEMLGMFADTMRVIRLWEFAFAVPHIKKGRDDLEISRIEASKIAQIETNNQHHASKWKTTNAPPPLPLPLPLPLSSTNNPVNTEESMPHTWDTTWETNE